MKKIFFLLLFSIFINSCNSDDSSQELVEITLKFTHYWDDEEITNQDFNQFKFTNENGEEISIERLRYLISNINLTNNKNYTLLDVGENSENLYSITNIPLGNNNLSFTFGFTDEDNIDGEYLILNTASFNVPAMLGGGYHFMQFDGKYLDTSNQEQPFNYHAIRAVDRTDPNDLIFEDTSFKVDLGNIEVTGNMKIEIKMNIAEWFKNPNTWNLNELNTVLMPNFEAQKKMKANGENVFTLGEVINN